MQNSVFRKKAILKMRDVLAHDKLSKVLGPIDLIAIGIGTIMGTGIFVLTGVEAAQHSGPAVIISLALAALTAIFISLVYTEVASAIPSSGGSYTYTYTALGEMPAFMVGFFYVFFCFCAIPAIAAGWGGYFVGILKQFHINIPETLTKNPFEGGIINLPAVSICLSMMLLLIKGVKESVTLSIVMVFIKLFVAFLFVGIAFPHFKLSNWADFMPFGFKGMTTSAGVLFFAFVGFDSVANAAEECKNPTRDITIGLIGSVIICTIVYILVATTLTGVVHYTKLNTPEPLSYVLRLIDNNTMAMVVAAGGVAGITTVVLFILYSMTRFIMAMSRDRLLPVVLSKIHKKYHTPYIATIICGLATATAAGIFPLGTMGALTSMSVLVVMMVVIVATLYLRKTQPTLKRPFKCPGIYFIGPAAILCCMYLLIGLVREVGDIFAYAFIFGIVVYFAYSKKRVDKYISTQGLK